MSRFLDWASSNAAEANKDRASNSTGILLILSLETGCYTQHSGRTMTPVRSTPSSHATQRSRGLFMAGIAVGALAVAGFGVWWTRAKAPQAPILKILTYSGHDYSPAASPDGKTVAFTSDRDGRPRIWLKDLASGRESALTPGPDDDARFAPDGSTILFSRTEGSLTSLYTMPVAGGE